MEGSYPLSGETRNEARDRGDLACATQPVTYIEAATGCSLHGEVAKGGISVGGTDRLRHDLS